MGHMGDLTTLLASAPLMLMPTMDMVVTATAVAMDTARGLLMPTMVDTAMVVMAMADMAMASKSYLVNGLTSLLLTFHDTHRNQTKIISPLSIMAGTRII